MNQPAHPSRLQMKTKYRLKANQQLRRITLTGIAWASRLLGILCSGRLCRFTFFSFRLHRIFASAQGYAHGTDVLDGREMVTCTNDQRVEKHDLALEVPRYELLGYVAPMGTR